MKRRPPRWSKQLKELVKLAMIAYILLQSSTSLFDIFFQNPTIQLTTVKKESNEKVYHPLYTFCPIFNESADVESPDSTLHSVMVENSFKIPHVYFERLTNLIDETPRTFSTWLKTHSIDKKRKVLLIQCTTVQFSESVVPGQHGGKVKYFDKTSA